MPFMGKYCNMTIYKKKFIVAPPPPCQNLQKRRYAIRKSTIYAQDEKGRYFFNMGPNIWEKNKFHQNPDTIYPASVSSSEPGISHLT